MSQYTIIEDCSPYYIRFTHPGIDELIELLKDNTPSRSSDRLFAHHKFDLDTAREVLSKTPVAKQIPLKEGRVSLFLSEPGLYYGAHKDGLNHHFSINYTVSILDSECVTSWYSDEDLKKYDLTSSPINIKNAGGVTSRECISFDKSKHTPLQTMVAKPNECILFNTEIFHDWDNSTSHNRRVVLTLRPIEQLVDKMYFEHARKILFGI
jgi:hypothetical protein